MYRSREKREKKLEEEGGKTRANNWYKRNGGVEVEGRQYTSTPTLQALS